jgi:hypothetical protein
MSAPPAAEAPPSVPAPGQFVIFHAHGHIIDSMLSYSRRQSVRLVTESEIRRWRQRRRRGQLCMWQAYPATAPVATRTRDVCTFTSPRARPAKRSEEGKKIEREEERKRPGSRRWGRKARIVFSKKRKKAHFLSCLSGQDYVWVQLIKRKVRKEKRCLRALGS